VADIKRLDDDGKLVAKYSHKRTNASNEGIFFSLSLKEFVQLVKDGGFISSDLGFLSGKKIVLARNNDKGGYVVGNCRFITQSENAHEKVISDKSRKASSDNAKRFNATAGPRHYAKMSAAGVKAKKATALLRRQAYEAIAHKSFLGNRNSQYGSFWITDGDENRKWQLDGGSLPSGFRRGRSHCFESPTFFYSRT
jgi:hypothetical protein